MGRNADTARAETPATLASFANAPIVVAALALAGAMAAVARFPNQPVPQPLVDRITDAQRAFEAAAGDFTLTMPEGGAAYDDAWIKSALEELDAGLKAKFEAIDTTHKEAAEFRKDSAQVIDDRFKALEKRVEAAEGAAKAASDRADAAEKAAKAAGDKADAAEKAAAKKPAEG